MEEWDESLIQKVEFTTTWTPAEEKRIRDHVDGGWLMWPRDVKLMLAEIDSMRAQLAQKEKTK